MIEQKLTSLENRYREIEKLLSDPAVISNNDEYRKLSKEHAYLAPIMQKFAELKKAVADLKNLEELKSSSDVELQVMAASEHEELAKKKARLEAELKLDLIPPDPNDDKDIIVEIRAGTGGNEAALFAGDLFRMYSRFAETKGWKTECMDMHPTGLGGFKEVVFSISGKGSWKFFKFERGIHRVQRVPETEASGRIHTSAVTVAVLPEAEDIDLEIKPGDLRVDTYRASGAGGQHVNKTESAVRITYIPTNIVVACQDERSQMKNRAKAMRIMKAKIYEERQVAMQAAVSSDRKAQVGSGDRSEKIRTYNFPQNRITDHRIDFSLYRLKEVMEGDLGELFDKLVQADNEKTLSGFMNLEDKEWTVCAVLDWTADYFERNGIPEPRLEAEVLLSHVLGCPRLELHLRKDDKVPSKRLSDFSRLIQERKKRKPVAYLTGEKEFMGLSFKVNENTLIPRPETELLVEDAVARIKSEKLKVVLELGTGCGNIAVSISKFSAAQKIYSSDVSVGALLTAQENACKHGQAGKIVLKQGDLFDAYKGDNIEGKVDLILSNPPYVALEESSMLAPELGFEPQIALFGGSDGLDFYRRIAAGSKTFLRPNGLITVELNALRSAGIRDIFETAGYSFETMIKDYSGLDRVITVRLING